MQTKPPTLPRATGISVVTDQSNLRASENFFRDIGFLPSSTPGLLLNRAQNFFINLSNLGDTSAKSTLSSTGEAGKSFHPFQTFHIDPGDGYTLENLEAYLKESGISYSMEEDSSGNITCIKLKDPENNTISFEKEVGISFLQKQLTRAKRVLSTQPDIIKADHVAIETKAIESMKTFYQKLGFRLVKTPDNVGGAWLYSINEECSETGFGLHLMDRSNAGAPRPEDPDTINISHLSLAFGKGFDTQTAPGILNILKRGEQDVTQKFEIDPSIGTRIEKIGQEEIQTLVIEQLLPIKTLILSLPSETDQLEAVKLSMKGASIEEIENFVNTKKRSPQAKRDEILINASIGTLDGNALCDKLELIDTIDYGCEKNGEIFIKSKLNKADLEKELTNVTKSVAGSRFIVRESDNNFIVERVFR